MTLAQDLAAVWESVRPVIEDAFMADAYTVKRMVMVSDNRGGLKPSTTPPTYDTVETGLCTLVVSNAQGDEYVSGASVTARAPYWADMPWSTEIAATDTIEINGRAFAVVAVKREGDWGVSVRAELEARS